MKDADNTIDSRICFVLCVCVCVTRGMGREGLCDVRDFNILEEIDVKLVTGRQWICKLNVSLLYYRINVFI